MTVLGIIPARKGSERFPAKHQAELLGKPMFAYTIEAALAARRLDRLVISSDDDTLRPIAVRYGVEFLERPAALCSATAALDDAVRHVRDTLAARDGFEPDVVVTMQGNVPVRKPGQIDEAIARLETLPHATAVCTAQQMRHRPEWAKVLADPATGAAVPFLTGYTSYRAQEYPPLYHMDGAIYAVRWSTLDAARGNTALHAWFGPRLHLLIQEHAMYALEVDYLDQIPLAEHYLLSQRQGDPWREPVRPA